MRVAYMGNLESNIARVWIDEMTARGVEAVAISQTEPSWDIEWAPLHIRPPKIRGLGLGRRALGMQIQRICEGHGVDVLHVQEARIESFWAAWSGLRPRMISVWGSDVLRLDEKPARHVRLVRSALATADAVTVGSGSLLEAAVAAGARPSRCHLIGWGVDTRAFCPDAAARQRVRAEWGFEDRKVVVSARRHEPLYRIGTILEAVALARRTDPAIALVVASYGSLTEELRARSSELGLTGHVVFTGELPRGGWPTMAAVLAGADAFCSIPETDGGPLSVLEAMSVSLSVVVRDIPVMREWISEGETGYLWDGESVERLGELLAEAVARSGEMGGRARAWVLANHDRKDEMDRAFRLYEELLAGGRAHG